MKKKIILVASLLGTLIFGGISNNATKEIYANDETSVIESSEIINESTEIESSFINSSNFINESEENTAKVLTDEEIESIVIQISNKLLGEELTDKLFAQFGIGIVAIVLIYVVFQMYERKKNRESQKGLEEASTYNQKVVNGIKRMVEDNHQEIESYKQEIVKLENINAKYVTDYKLLTKTMMESLEKSSKTLEQYSQIDVKVNAILDCLDLLSSTPDGVREGISKKVKETVKGVKENGKEKDESVC